MTASGFFRMKKLKGSGKVLVASRHNKRTIQAEQGATGNIDAARSALNNCLHGPDTPADVAQLAQSLMALAGITSHKCNAVLGLELIFSLPTGTTIPLDRYFIDCLQWAVTNFGGLGNVLSADVHLDEGAPHMHVLILPLVGSRMNGSAMFGNRHRLLHLHTDFHAAVSGQYGLAKAPARLQGRAREQTAQAVLQRLFADNDAALSSLIWSVLRDAIDRDPVPFAETLGIDIAKPPDRKLRTMPQIFTSTGKGSNKLHKPIGNETAHTPIGLHRPAKDPTLSCVVIATKPPAPAQTDEPAIERAECDEKRVIDRGDCDFSDWPD